MWIARSSKTDIYYWDRLMGWSSGEKDRPQTLGRVPQTEVSKPWMVSRILYRQRAPDEDPSSRQAAVLWVSPCAGSSDAI